MTPGLTLASGRQEVLRHELQPVHSTSAAGVGRGSMSSMPASRSRGFRAIEGCWETFLYILKAGPAGGRLRRPSSAGRPDRSRNGSSAQAADDE
jgi:hypothetical protein